MNDPETRLVPRRPRDAVADGPREPTAAIEATIDALILHARLGGGAGEVADTVQEENVP